jgi:hypothetical protein
MSRGIVGPFETRKQGIAYPSLRGDIEKTAGLTVYELDEEVVDFARWRPFDQVSRSAVLAPAREDGGAGRRVAADTIALSSAGREELARERRNEADCDGVIGGPVGD